ncbi:MULTISPECIES: hypothetical protein [Candidatus Accumulibacter]|jgi:hypothetical protein|uniref:DUF6946 domain-containing protein n=1 Tax=Candidatus Accumulibacter phosphatis TaxID=327160 RepID=A0ABX1TZU7_9PROT|nr:MULTISPECIES: hypothetical protein [Candidatus Accumulibacter]NMQ28447.1 hypothetical protein [Candidatus Accumulibacter phosphatis]
MPIAKRGHVIASLTDWETYGNPKASYHWIDGRSAKEVARAWLVGGGTALPPEVASCLAAHSRFGAVLSWEAEPEAKLRFDNFPGEPRNSDLAVYVTDAIGPYLLAVEAKADEPYGDTVSKTLADALERRLENPRSNGVARVEQLARSLFSPRVKGEPRLGDLRYQLLTACAGAVSEARRKGYSRAVMLVHEFVTSETQPGNHKRNSSDLSAFVYRLSGGGTTEVADDRLVGPFIVPGAAEVELFIGKVVRRLGTSGPQSDAWRGQGRENSLGLVA